MEKPTVSVILPAYNEAAIIEKNLGVLYAYMSGLSVHYEWEMLIVNDGSSDQTADLAEAFATAHEKVRVLHQPNNAGLGQAFKLAFANTRSDYLVTMDMDLSYAPEHIERLLEKIIEGKAKVVVASPYMEGGKVSSIPFMRLQFSVWANRFLSLVTPGKISTVTGMVRAYDGKFLRGIPIKSIGMEVNPELLYKTNMLRGRIDEIPAHLDWSDQVAPQTGTPERRKSSIRLPLHTLYTLLSGFLFRPFLFFLVPGLLIFLYALYAGAWGLKHLLYWIGEAPGNLWIFGQLSFAMENAFEYHTHVYVTGGLALILAVQLVSLGIYSLQHKRYFEELYNLGCEIYRKQLAQSDDESEG